MTDAAIAGALRDYARAKAALLVGTREQRTAKAPDRDDWKAWLAAVFGSHVKPPFAPYHAEFWRYIFGLELGKAAPAFVGIWPRGFGKSTSVELAAAVVAALGTRRYILYVSATQDQANDHVQNVASLLETDRFERYFPLTARRQMTKYGTSKAWRQSRLRTADGVTIDAIGLDSAARGAKMDDVRPDLIICDDIDGLKDTTRTVKNKIDTLTKTILPAGGKNRTVVIVQNLIHQNSIVSRIADGRADFLTDKTVSGPHPAIVGLEVEERAREDGNGRTYKIVAGATTWEARTIDDEQHEIDTLGISAYLAEKQQLVKGRGGSMFAHLVYQRIDWADLPDLERIEVWVDPAVTSTGDCQGIQADGRANGKVYRLWSWEQQSSPEGALTAAIKKARELGADLIGVETDQGGETWYSTYELTWNKLVAAGEIPADEPRIYMTDAKAGAGHGSKAHRTAHMVASYERGEIVHVRGTHDALETAQGRYLVEKPYDLVDAGYWSWHSLTEPATEVDVW